MRLDLGSSDSKLCATDFSQSYYIHEKEGKKEQDEVKRRRREEGRRKRVSLNILPVSNDHDN